MRVDLLGVVSPCKDCEERCLGCHGKCSKYANYRAYIDEKKQQKSDFQATHSVAAFSELKAKRFGPRKFYQA